MKTLAGDSHSGKTNKLLIWLALYPDVAEAASMKAIPRFNLRKPLSTSLAMLMNEYLEV